MVLNPFFTQGTTGEQNLVQDLINEQLKIYGVDIFYLPRKYLTTNTEKKCYPILCTGTSLAIQTQEKNHSRYSRSKKK